MKTTILNYQYTSRKKEVYRCSLLEKSIQFSVRKNDQSEKLYIYRYTEIEQIHLSLPDISWHSIDIYFRDNVRLHLKSVTYFIELNGNLIRPNINDTDFELIQKNNIAYCNFVLELHKRIESSVINQSITFTQGNSWLKGITWLILITLTIGIPILWKIGNVRWSLFFGSAFLLLLLYSLKINFRKHYSINQIPKKYLT